MDIKKFLDVKGLSYLWNKLSLQDYPNNDTLVAVINAIDKNKADKTTTEALQQAIDILNGTGDGSVKYTVADAIANIIAQAPEDFDTLKEIADWIAKDETGTLDLIGRVEKAEADIEDLKPLDVQADWAQTDETAIDFIKNKPDIAEQIDNAIASPKLSMVLVDQVNGYNYIICMRNGELVSYCATQNIEITTMPTKTEYYVGDYFDPTGMVVTAVAQDGSTKEITNYTYINEPLSEEVTHIEISYLENNIMYTVDVPIIINNFTDLLIDFDYTDNNDGTYTITGWKGTYNGEPSTEIVIPDSKNIIV